MKPRLMYRDRDFDMQRELPSNTDTLTRDLGLDPLFEVMAADDEFALRVIRQTLFSGLENTCETILYRQAVLRDCLEHTDVIDALYAIALEAVERRNRPYFGISGHYPRATLYGAIELLEMLTGTLGKLKALADQHADRFQSEGFGNFFTVVRRELQEDYLAAIEAHLKTLKFERGIWLGAGLNIGGDTTDYMLHPPPQGHPDWFRHLLTHNAYTIHIDPRDEAGARALAQLNNQGLNEVANTAAQSAEHLLRFFTLLRTELAFYRGTLHLQKRLAGFGAPICFPVPAPAGSFRHEITGLYDVTLALALDRRVVGNELHGSDKRLTLITGANQGGKSTFLRSIGLAQLMMQCGLFVAAENFTTDIRRHLFTHFKSEEDPTLAHGKFEEELERMDQIMESLAPDSLLLFNESFATTNEREGSEIARQVLRALLEVPVKVFFVSHWYDLTHGLYQQALPQILFLRAERRSDGQRTFKLSVGEPLQTSFGQDLYAEIFEHGNGSSSPPNPS